MGPDRFPELDHRCWCLLHEKTPSGLILEKIKQLKGRLRAAFFCYRASFSSCPKIDVTMEKHSSRIKINGFNPTEGCDEASSKFCPLTGFECRLRRLHHKLRRNCTLIFYAVPQFSHRFFSKMHENATVICKNRTSSNPFSSKFQIFKFALECQGLTRAGKMLPGPFERPAQIIFSRIILLLTLMDRTQRCKNT